MTMTTCDHRFVALLTEYGYCSLCRCHHCGERVLVASRKLQHDGPGRFLVLPPDADGNDDTAEEDGE